MRAASNHSTAARTLSLPAPLKGVFAWLFAQPDDPDDEFGAPAAEPAAEPMPEPAPVVESPMQMPTDEELVRQAEADLAAQQQEGEVIQITGSAIERTETTTAAPVTVLDRQELEASGMVSVGDILQDLPANSNAINTQANNGGDGSTRVDIRGLGTARTLVLVNGRRHVAGGTGADASVDLNAIPLAVIERVEVLKDGASAVYGSDAIGGVVNIITRSNFQGAEASFYTGTTQRGGGTTYDVSFIAGQASPKGNVVFSAGFFDQQDVFADQRGFSNPQRGIDWDCVAQGMPESECEFTSGSSATPEGTVIDYFPDDGNGPVCPSGRCIFDPSLGGTGYRDANFGDIRGVGNGDAYNFQPDNYLLTPQRRANVWSNGNYKLHDNARAFFEASYVNRQSQQQLAPEPLFTISEGIVVSPDSVYNPFGKEIYDVRKRMVETGPRIFTQDVNTFRLVTGLDGKLPENLLKGWKWELSYNYGRTDATNINQGNLVRPNVAEALGPSYVDNGVVRCGTPDNPGSDGCVPLDVFGGVGSITPEMIDWITYTGVARGFNKQHTALAQAHGPVVKLPNNGDIVTAVGTSYSRFAGGFQPDPLTATGNTTGNKVEPTIGHYDVVSGFGEISIVPVTGQDWAKWLELSLAGRVVNYSTFGSNFSYKTGLLYKAPMGLAVRGTYGTAFRAPGVGELFSGQFDDFPNIADPCSTENGQLDNPVVAANCARDPALAGQGGVTSDVREQMPARSGGNPEVQPETATVFTAGVVYEPPFAEGLSLTVDYFQVSIDDVIQRAGSNILLSNCYAQADQQDCDKISRGGGGLITEINDTVTNIGNLETAGIDVGVGYRYDLPGAGRLRHDLEGTFLRQYDRTIGDVKTTGLGYYDLGVYPRFRGNFSTMWGMPDLGIGAGFNVRYIHGFRECDGDDCSGSNASRRVDSNTTADIYASYSLKSPAGASMISAGVNNLLDVDPPNVYNGFLATSDSNTYDYLGRYFYLRLTQAF
jgi:iron complex outermembrane recepter protein